MKKVIRTATVALSLDVLLSGQLTYLNKTYETIAVSGQDKHLEIVKSREGVRTVAVEMQRNISPFRDFKSLRLLYKTFKKEKPLIVHSITPKAGLLSMLAAKAAGVPIRMHTFTGLIFPTRKGAMQKLLIKMDQLLCASATNIYPEGEGVKKDLLTYNITKKPLKILANGNVNGIETTHFSPQQIPQDQQEKLRKELNILKDDFVFIFVGRLVGDKGINELVKGFQNLNASLNTHQAKLVLVGPLETELDPLKPETLKEIQTNSNIITTGYQNDVRPYFAVADALVFPSYREGFPNVVMQAGAMGLPSIVSNINGCNEIVMEGKNGTIVPSKNSEVLQKAMERMLQDSQWHNQLASNARKMIVDRYEQQKVWDALLAEYQHLEEQYKLGSKRS